MKTTRKFRLYKRADDGREMASTDTGYKDRPYYFRFTHRGKAYPRCLETPDATEAQRRAKAKYAEIVAAVSTGEYKRLDATKLRHEHSATRVDLYAAYRIGPARASADTRQLNLRALDDIAGPFTYVSELVPSRVRTWFETVNAIILVEPDQERAGSLQTSANSKWRKARSVFRPKCLESYRDKNLFHETMEAFVRAGNAAKFENIPKVDYHPPRQDILAATFAAWEALANPANGDTHRDLFLAIGHELAFGLRIAEFAQARWNWHHAENGYPVIEGKAHVKARTGIVRVRALDPWFSTMQRLATDRGWWPSSTLNPQPSTDLIIPGSASYRTDGLFRAVSDWLRQLGWETRKTNHALRAYAGGQVAMKYGIYEAQVFLRHSTVKVTEQNYSYFINHFKPANLDTLAARWATVPEKAKVSSAVADVTLDAPDTVPLNSAKLRVELPWKMERRN
jgi:hypothetical protein